MKTKGLFIAAAILGAVSLTACSSGTGTDNKSGASAQKADAIKAGAQTMRTALGEAQKAVDSGDASKLKLQAEALETAWAKFEDDVKAKDKSIYEKIEDPLGAVQAGAKANTIDKNVLTDQIRKLDLLLADLAK